VVKSAEVKVNVIWYIQDNISFLSIVMTIKYPVNLILDTSPSLL